MEILYKDDFERQDIWRSMVKTQLEREGGSEPSPEEVEEVEELHIDMIRTR